jgi:hypothetical protein
LACGYGFLACGYADACSIGLIEKIREIKPMVKIITGSDITDAVSLYNCILHFYTTDFLFYNQPFNVINVLKNAPLNTPSLLGMDFLQNYKISFTGNGVVLERV